MLPLRCDLLVWLMCLPFITVAQDNWARRVGAWSNDAFADVAIDPQGFLYAVGEFGGNITLDPTTTLVSNGNWDILVAKYDPNGSLVWVRTFGGSGLDRAVKVALTNDGQIAVVGQFMLSVVFDGTTLVSQASTQDMFVLKMAQSDGAVSWVHQGGSPDGVDQPNGVSVGPDGSIAVAGEFLGTAVFDQGTLTSIVDPDTGDPSVDIFLAVYASDGSPLWLKHGAADHADRGMDVAHDPAGNVYLTGQFSDTLTFDQTHNNAMYSAVFIARFNAAGQEEWFRVFGGGTYNQVFEMQLVEGDRLMLVGDVQGTVIFLDTEPDLWTVDQPRSSFLLEVGLDGEMLRQKNWGSEYLLNTRALSIQGDDILVLGRFACQFTGFSAIYGDGTFISTGPYDLYVARFQLNDFIFKEAQQFGGQGDKVPGGIVHATDAAPVFTGSYEYVLVFPGGAQFDVEPTGAVQVPYVAVPYCADGNYDGYVDLRGSALKDAFIARGYDDAREPYDIFTRTGNGCERDFLPPFIRVGVSQGVLGPDTLVRCNSAYLSAATWTSYTADTSLRHTAPDFTFLWSTGSVADVIQVTTTGWYHLTVSFGLGCQQYTDSVYMIINPLPPILLFNDDVVVNTNAQPPTPIEVCEPDYPWLWISGQPPENWVDWNGPLGNVVSDSLFVTLSGIYTATAHTPAGCIRQDIIHVEIFPAGPLADYDVELPSHFPLDMDGNDTVQVCMLEQVVCVVEPIITLNGVPALVPDWVRILYNCGGDWSQNPLPPFQCPRSATGEGWYIYSFGFALTNAPCGVDTLMWFGIDSVYVMPWPLTYPQVSLTGPDLICPGDTVALLASCSGCDATEWNGPGTFIISGDTAWIFAPGTYSFEGSALDTNGCITNTDAALIVEWNPNPLLGVDPLDGIICPNSTATIWTETGGLSYQWYGPLGPLSVNNDTIVSSQQGFYYLEMTDSLGCDVSSDPILLTDYATPYLNVLPDNVLCEPGETAILQVITTSTATLLWEAPFAGSNALQQTVTQPGIYTCHVTACGIVTTLSVEIYGNTANAELTDPGPYELCSGDELTLTAAPGGAFYVWFPGQFFGPELTVDTAGTYLLVVSNAAGCKDSLFVEVTALPEYAPLTVLDNLFCVGEPINIFATGDGTITWYADAAQTQVIWVGTQLWLGPAVNDTTVWVEQIVGPCSSGLIQWNVHVVPIPEAPVLIGDTTVCEGSTLLIGTQEQDEVTYTWYGPDGQTFFTGPVLALPNAGLQHGGQWLVVASNAGCGPATTHFNLTVIDAATLSIGPDTTICPGGSALFEVPPGFTQPQWIGGGSTTTYTTGSEGEVWLAAIDVNGCAVHDTALVSIFSFTQPISVTGSVICLGESTTLVASGSGTFTWYADQELTQLVHMGASWYFEQPQDSALYYVVQSEGACSAVAVPVLLAVVPFPNDAQLIVPDVACEGAELVLSLVGNGEPTGVWTTPGGGFEGPVLTITDLGQDDAGIYTVVPFLGFCAGDTLSTTIEVLVPLPFTLGADTVFCDGGSVTLNAPTGFDEPLWSTGSSSASIIVVEPGIYSVAMLDAQGCAVTDAVLVDVTECDDIIPNVITPNGDGTNDVWILGPGGYVAAELEVYNRWGQIVWRGDMIHTGFSGRHMDSGEPLPDGTYFYVLHLVRTRDRSEDHTGYLTLLR